MSEASGRGFYHSFLRECKKSGLPTLAHHSYFLKNLSSGQLTVKCDRIQAREWEPFANAILNDNSVKNIFLYCELSHSVTGPSQQLKQVPQTKKQQQQLQQLQQQKLQQQRQQQQHKTHLQRGRCPAIQEVGTSLRVCRGLGGCIAQSQVLRSLNLANLVFTHDNLACLSHGLSVTQTLTELRFVDCKMGDDGVSAIYPGLLDNLSISILQFERCNLTDKSAMRIAKVIQHHALRRHTDNWQARLREPEKGENDETEGDTERDKEIEIEKEIETREIETREKERETKRERISGGLERVLLGGNRIADEGASSLASSLKLDLWMLELDLSGNFIGLEGGKALRDALLENVTLVSLVLKDNKILDTSILSEISSGVEMNADKKNQDSLVSKKRNEPNLKHSTTRSTQQQSSLKLNKRQNNSGKQQSYELLNNNRLNSSGKQQTNELQSDVMTLLQRERALRESLEHQIKTLKDENHSLRDSVLSFSSSQRNNINGKSSSTRILHDQENTQHTTTTQQNQRPLSQLSIADLDTSILSNNNNNNNNNITSHSLSHHYPHHKRSQSPQHNSNHFNNSNNFNHFNNFSNVHSHFEMEDWAQNGRSSRGDSRRTSLELEKQLENSRTSREATQDMDVVFFKRDKSPHHHSSTHHNSYHNHNYSQKYNLHYQDENEEDDMALERLEDSFRNLNNLLSRLESENSFTRPRKT